MNDWIQCAEDLSWLPELTDLSLTLDTDGLCDNQSKRPKQNLVERLERKWEEFLNIFLTSHPNVKVESSFK